jgi:hypothetical protein
MLKGIPIPLTAASVVEGTMNAERQAVVSSHLATVSYDEEAQALEVETRQGRH